MTTTFYAPPDHFTDGLVRFPDDEARHAVRALRHGVGDEIEAVDGAGGRYRVRLTKADKRGAAGEVVAEARDVGEPPYGLTVGLGVLKTASRFETFVEKAVELGVTRIVPLVTERTETVRIKRNRLDNILVAALKQSGRSRLPVLGEPQSLEELLEEESGLRVLCHESAEPESALLRIVRDAPAWESATLLVGPEGGFSEAEVARAEASGWAVASLGPRRLRAETAALTAASAVMLHRALHP